MLYACTHCENVTLLLTDPESLPSREDMKVIAASAKENDTAVSVHLPDVFFDNAISACHGYGDVLACIEASAPLGPQYFIIHAEFSACKNSHGLPDDDSKELCLDFFKRAGEAMKPALLLAENIESYNPYAWDFLPFSRCVDVGHLIKDGIDPIRFLRNRLNSTKIIHFHGVDPSGRDHLPLTVLKRSALDNVLFFLWESHYDGIVTFECFGETEFEDSVLAAKESYNRFRQRHMS